MIDPGDPTSSRSPVDWNDNDGIDSDGLKGDTEGNDNISIGKLSSNASTTDNNAIAKITLTETPHAGDNFIAKTIEAIPFLQKVVEDEEELDYFRSAACRSIREIQKPQKK